MAEDGFLKNERQYFVEQNADILEIPAKKLAKALELYNKHLQTLLIDESPFVAVDLGLTMQKHRGEKAIESK